MDERLHDVIHMLAFDQDAKISEVVREALRMYARETKGRDAVTDETRRRVDYYFELNASGNGERPKLLADWSTA